YTAPEKLEEVKQALDGKEINISSAEIVLVPKSTVRVEGKEAHQILDLMGELEDHDDVQSVASNFDIPDEILEEAGR
ncbi:MAG: YebC/PmpR family DNA-binding transcriptional regulator, partial [bacterium]